MTPFSPVTICLPIADRPTSYRFYRALGLSAFGDEIAADGLPEPLRFTVNDGVRIMLIPTGGFHRISGDHEVAAPGTSEVVVTVDPGSPDAVDGFLARAVAAGATVVTAAGRQPWGYVGAVADPDGHVWMAHTT